MKKLLHIGGASFDTLHLEDRTVDSIGGVGMYTTMAACRCGTPTAIFGLLPDPFPDSLQPVAAALSEWCGPVVKPDELPRFEISYKGGKTEYLNLYLGSVDILTPNKLPEDLSMYDLVHCAQRCDIPTQLAFLNTCRKRGIKRISAGTYPGDATQDPGSVRAIIENSDYFFMNDLEAATVFGSLEAAAVKPGSVLFITLGAKGALVIQGDYVTFVPSVPANELDPTGAGDTFCGASLAFILQNEHPIMAAHKAVALAGEMIEHVGPSALFSKDPPPEPPLDPRVRVNADQVWVIAREVSKLDEVSPYPFVSPELPPVGHPKTLDYFFAATLQQFSFWYAQENRYQKPMIAPIGGVELKGSDYLWAALTRALMADPDFGSPERQASLTRSELLDVFRADNGEDPMPALDLHLEMANKYGQDMLALGLTPEIILERAQNSTSPLDTFLAILDQVAGYKEDPLRKKSSLLAMILNQRPEVFFSLPNGGIAPVVDYHLLRSALRVGLVDVVDPELTHKLLNRDIVSPSEEWVIRFATYCAVESLTELSGKNSGIVDWFFFNARIFCPEMSEPVCQDCQLDHSCAHRKGLFQPVLRTSFY
jgi:sugar/nucleoside kinase (ribokinase family)